MVSSLPRQHTHVSYSFVNHYLRVTDGRFQLIER